MSYEWDYTGSKDKVIRPRLTENEYNYWQLKKLWDRKLYKAVYISDPHGWLADLTALRCFNKVLQSEPFDEVIINGDIVDMPYISRHAKRLNEDGIMNGYSEVEEIEYTKEQILKPLRLSTNAKIRIRLGNHDERITSPLSISESQKDRLLVLAKHYNTSHTNLAGMLGIQKDGKDVDNYIYDANPVTSWFDMFDATHGLSLAKNAAEKNIYEYMGSGTSGHTHRLNSKFLTNRKSPYVWFESGCMRLTKDVEYLPTGKVADHQQGFIPVSFIKEQDDVLFFGEPHIIINGMCKYNGMIYNGNSQ
jgi:predicted phosphodiesterase